MADVKKLAKFLDKWEGGYSNDPFDAGGATYKGVTLGTYELYCKSRGLKKPGITELQKMKSSEWIDVLKVMYWDKCGGDFIQNQSVANLIVDWYWNSGIYGIKLPQKVLGVAIDGVIGAETINAINNADQKSLFEAIKSERIDFIDRICRSRPSNIRFKRGWLNRINDLKYE